MVTFVHDNKQLTSLPTLLPLFSCWEQKRSNLSFSSNLENFNMVKVYIHAAELAKNPIYFVLQPENLMFGYSFFILSVGWSKRVVKRYYF